MVASALILLLLLLLLQGCCGLVDGAPEEAQEQERRPNILIIMTDQLSSAQMTQRGYPYVTTPGMDLLASEGISFSRAYTTFPLCRPSRLSMFTGRMPSQATQLVDDVYPSLLRTQGQYKTAYFGKWHVGTTTMDDKDWHRIQTAVLQHNDTKTEAMAVKFLRRYAMKRCRRNRRQHPRDSSSNDKSSRPLSPFLLVVSFLNPHDCCQTARRVAGGGPEDNIAFHDFPVNYQQDLQKCPPLPTNFHVPVNETQAFAIRRGCVHGEHDWHVLPTKGWTLTQWRQYLYSYDRLIEMADGHVLNVRRALEQYGLLDDTAILYLADHGSGRASHEWTAKQTFYEEAVGVPMIMSWKGHMKHAPGYLDNTTLVSTGLDLFSTVLSLANVPLPKDHPAGGMDLTKVAFRDGGAEEAREETTTDHDCKGKGMMPRHFVVSELKVDKTKGENLKGRMLVTDETSPLFGRRLKYMLFDGGTFPEQLFDLTVDPGETMPVVNDTSYQHELHACRKALKEFLEEIGDPFAEHVPSSVAGSDNNDGEEGTNGAKEKLLGSVAVVAVK